MTGEELLFLVWLFLGLLLLVYTIRYIRMQRLIVKFSEFAQAMAGYRRALKRLIKGLEEMETIHWEGHIDTSEEFKIVPHLMIGNKTIKTVTIASS